MQAPNQFRNNPKVLVFRCLQEYILNRQENREGECSAVDWD